MWLAAQKAHTPLLRTATNMSIITERGAFMYKNRHGPDSSDDAKNSHNGNHEYHTKACFCKLIIQFTNVKFGYLFLPLLIHCLCAKLLCLCDSSEDRNSRELTCINE